MQLVIQVQTKIESSSIIHLQMKTQHIHMIENFSICQKDLAVLIKYLGKEADKYGCAVSLNTL